MNQARWLATIFLVALGTGNLDAFGRSSGCSDIDSINSRLQGQVLDFTCNHGADRRILAPALCQKRDMYVYVPPQFRNGIDSKKAYPILIFLHGAGQNEQFFLQNLAEPLDQLIVAGKLPPFFIAAPDGSLKRSSSPKDNASSFVNSLAGNFEDFIEQDVWQFMTQSFPILPERENHVLMGVSMGGTGAFGQAIKYKERYKTVVGFMPAVNLRWVDACGHYRSKFNPNSWGWREQLRPMEVIAQFGRLGLIKVRAGQLFRPLVGTGPDAIARLSEFNPIEIMYRSDLKDKELNMYIAYAGCDEFNIDAQVDSFLYLAKERGITVSADFYPCGHHDTATGMQMMPRAVEWINSTFAK